jgi:hypothetical protein
MLVCVWDDNLITMLANSLVCAYACINFLMAMTASASI